MQAGERRISCIRAIIPLTSLWHSKEHSLNVHTVTGICQALAECQACFVVPWMWRRALGSFHLLDPAWEQPVPTGLEEDTMPAHEWQTVDGVLRHPRCTPQPMCSLKPKTFCTSILRSPCSDCPFCGLKSSSFDLAIKVRVSKWSRTHICATSTT